MPVARIRQEDTMENEYRTASLWASGFITLKDPPPEGTYPLMMGSLEDLTMILDGNADPVDMPILGENIWRIGAVEEADNPTQSYIAAMLWLARVSKQYSDTKVIFGVNNAANKDLKRATAKAIGKKLY